MNKKLIINITGITLCVLLFIMAVFLGITSMTFYSGENQSAPNIFGYNIYIVKNNDFYQLKKGTAAIAETVWPDEVYSGEIIIYRMGEGDAVKLGLVRTATLKEAVMSYEIENELGDIMTLSQGQLVAKVTHFSDFLGGFILFATSPFGVMAIAFLPCLGLIIFELVRFIICKLPSPEVETIKKQEELPTFIPKKERDELSRKREQEKDEKKALAKEKKILTTDKATSVSKSDEFTEKMRQKKAKETAQTKPEPAPAIKNPSEVRDRPDFSAAARRRMEEDSKKAEEKAKAEEEKKPPEIKKPAPVIPSIASSNEGEPAISQVFSEDKDKKYNIDDILADITGKK
ncbi:MAG: hypothetical protein IJZ51_01740 [Ruminiclostridium sp.]|nr:hypothetical protein [Ruminiclostridium sp.]